MPNISLICGEIDGLDAITALLIIHDPHRNVFGFINVLDCNRKFPPSESPFAMVLAPPWQLPLLFDFF